MLNPSLEGWVFVEVCPIIAARRHGRWECQASQVTTQLVNGIKVWIRTIEYVNLTIVLYMKHVR